MLVLHSPEAQKLCFSMLQTPQHNTFCILLQTRVLGVKYGEWGRRNFPGLKPTKLDLLDWKVRRLTELRRLILAQQTKCSQRPGPTAFVTFRCPLFLN